MGKHLTLQDREYIQKSLEAGSSIRSISMSLNKSLSTISREIRSRRIVDNSSAYGRVKNRCVNRYNCTERQLCLDKPDCTTLCRSCKHCNSVCAHFTEEHCTKLDSAPYVCNGCDNKRSCTLKKFIYSASKADSAYRTTLSEARSGFNLTDSELNYIDGICSPLLKKGSQFITSHLNTVTNSFAPSAHYTVLLMLPLFLQEILICLVNAE